MILKMEINAGDMKTSTEDSLINKYSSSSSSSSSSSGSNEKPVEVVFDETDPIHMIEELTETIDALDVELNELKAAGGSSSSNVIKDDVKESKEGVTTIGFGFSSSSSSFFTAPSTTAPNPVAGIYQHMYFT
jgi:hypothetical protein